MRKNNDSDTQRREFIKYQLRLRGTSLAQVGRELGVTTATMSQVCLGVRTSQRILVDIARRLDTSPEALKSGAIDREDAM